MQNFLTNRTIHRFCHRFCHHNIIMGCSFKCNRASGLRSSIYFTGPWSTHKETLSYDATKHSEYTTLDACASSCASQSSCVAINFVAPGSWCYDGCWFDTNVTNLGRTALCSSTTQYHLLNRTCALCVCCRLYVLYLQHCNHCQNATHAVD